MYLLLEKSSANSIVFSSASGGTAHSSNVNSGTSSIDGVDSFSNIVLYDKENDLPFSYAGLHDKCYLRDYSGLKFRIEEDFIDEEILSLCKELRYDAMKVSTRSYKSVMKSIEAKILSINYKLFENIGRKLDFKVDSIGLVAPDIPNKTLNIKITWI